MKRATLAFALALGLSLAGCLLRGKQAASPAIPPAPNSVAAASQAESRPSPADSAGEPLSIPQTQVRLPQPQPIDPEAAPPPPTATLPEPPPTLAAPRPARRSAPVPAKPDAAEAADASHPADPPRPRVEPLLPADERRQLIDDIDKRLHQAEDLVNQISQRSLNQDQKTAVERIRSFAKLSRQALDRGETQQAGALADRALLLAQELGRAK